MCKQEIEDGELEEPTEAAVSPTGMELKRRVRESLLGASVGSLAMMS